jgi:phospholipid transport system substrate-binding protein
LWLERGGESSPAGGEDVMHAASLGSHARANEPPAMPYTHRRSLLLALAAPLALPAPALAQAGPTASIEQLHAALLHIMQNADRLGVKGREAHFRPVISRVFNLDAMARIACGPPWNGFTPTQQQAVQKAFADWSIATYANRFDGFSGESFATDGEGQTERGDVMVRTRIIRPNDSPVALNYLMRQDAGTFRVVDIYLTGTISELASRRSEFTGILRDGGADRLVAELNRRTVELLK